MLETKILLKVCQFSMPSKEELVFEVENFNNAPLMDCKKQNVQTVV